MNALTFAVIAFAALLAILVVGFPIAFGLGLIGIIGLIITMGLNLTISIAGQVVDTTTTSFLLIALPLFVIMAEALYVADISKDIFDCMYKWVGHLPGGVAIANTVASMFFGAVCGTGIGTAAAIGTISIPEMLRYKYNRNLIAGTVASTSALGMIIPPSLPLILYGAVTDASVGALFIGSIIPGVLMAVLFSAFIMIRATKNPYLAPKAIGVSWKDRLLSLKKIWAVVILAVLVLGSIYGGVATVTESAAVGAFGALVIAIASKRLNWTNFKKILVNTTRVTGMIFMIMIGAHLFSYLLTNYGVGQGLSEFMKEVVGSPVYVLAIFIGIMLFLGCFLDIAPIILIAVPVFSPTIATMGFDQIWLGVVFLIALCIGTITPPVGMLVFVTKGVFDLYSGDYEEISIADVFNGSIPFLLPYIIGLILLLAFPALITWLPSMMLKPPSF